MIIYKEAIKIINNSKKPYEVLKGYWLEKNKWKIKQKIFSI